MDITINAFAFVGLVLLAIIGGLCVGVAGGLFVWLLHESGKQDRANKKEYERLEQARQQREQEHQRVRKLLQSVFDNPEQGATI